MSRFNRAGIEVPLRQFVLNIPYLAAGANKLYFDLWNLTGETVYVESVKAIKNGDTAVTGTLALQFSLLRTTAIGTTGTAASAEGTSITAPSIAKLNQMALPSGLTARSAPGGGATSGAVLGYGALWPEEVGTGSYVPSELAPAPFEVPTGSGIKVIQGAVASVGNTAFQVLFGFERPRR